MLSKASRSGQPAVKGITRGPLNNNVSNKTYAGSQIGKGPIATIVQTGASGRKFGPTG